MDWDLWGPPCEPVAEESNLYTQPEWQCDFYFGYGFDAIEEDALNEKYCIQVLRILITKADTEIDKLEEDLISLQSELAWVENTEWSEICCNALREKINCLDISIKSLRDKDNNDVEVHLLMHTQPVERLHEILKALLRKYFCKKDEQAKEVKDASILNSSFDVPRQAINIMDENKRLGNHNSEFITSEEMRESNSTRGHGATLNPSLKQQEKKTNNPKTVKPTNAGLKESSPCSLKLEAGPSDEEIPSSYIGPKNTGKGEGREYGFSPNGHRTIQNLSSKSADKGRCSVEKIKAQPTNVGVSNSISGASEYAVDNSNEKKKLSDSDSVVVSEEVEEHSSISTADLILSSLLEPTVNRTYPDKKVKLANAIVKDLGLNASRHATGDPYKMKNLCKSNLKVSGNEEYCCRATGKSKTSSSFMNPDDKGIHPRTDKLADTVVKNVSAKELRCVTDLNRKKRNLDKEQKLSDFTLKAACKQPLKELKVTAAEKVVSLNSALKTEGTVKNPLQVVKTEPALSETENSALTSLLEMQDKEGKNTVKLQIKEEGENMPEVKMSEIVADEKQSNLNLSLNSQEEQAKRNIKSNPPILQEIGLSTIVVDSSSSSISKGKKRKKSGAGALNASLNQDWNTTKKVVVKSGKLGCKENDASSEDNPNPVSQPHKKRKKSSNSVSIIIEVKDINPQMDFSNSQSNTTNNSTESCSNFDFIPEAAATMPSALILEKMSLAELRVIAKQHKLTKYYKLSKKAILQQLADRMGDS